MTANANPILSFKNISKKFNQTNALSDVTLDIQAGRITGLLGPNGSGKTTLIKLAAGLMTPTSGTVAICGNPVGVKTKSITSYLPDQEYLNQWMKVSQLFDYYNDFFSDFDRNKANEMLRHLDIKNNDRLKTMSKGTKEKVQLILTMSRQADLYLLDEPIGGVDPATRDYILNTIITNYNEDGAVIISTHLISDIEQVLDDIIFLKQGKIELQSSVDQIRHKYEKSVDDLFREVFRC